MIMRTALVVLLVVVDTTRSRGVGAGGVTTLPRTRDDQPLPENPYYYI